MPQNLSHKTLWQNTLTWRNPLTHKPYYPLTNKNIQDLKKHFNIYDIQNDSLKTSNTWTLKPSDKQTLIPELLTNPLTHWNLKTETLSQTKRQDLKIPSDTWIPENVKQNIHETLLIKTGWQIYKTWRKFQHLWHTEWQFENLQHLNLETLWQTNSDTWTFDQPSDTLKPQDWNPLTNKMTWPENTFWYLNFWKCKIKHQWNSFDKNWMTTPKHSKITFWHLNL